MQLDIGDEQVLDEGGSLAEQVPIVADHHGAAVKDELVLAPHLVDVGDGAAGLRHTVSEDLTPLHLLTQRVGRGVDRDDQLGSLSGHRRGRSL